MSPLSKFEMALRGLLALDMQELVDGGVIADRDYAAWDEFQADRVRVDARPSGGGASSLVRHLEAHWCATGQQCRRP